MINKEQDSTFLNENKENSLASGPTGPGPEGLSGFVFLDKKVQAWPNIEEKSKNNDNDEAIALLDLRAQFNDLGKKANIINISLEKYNSNLNKVENIVYAIVFVTIVAFIVGFYQITADKIGEKELLLNYDNLYQKSYFLIK